MSRSPVTTFASSLAAAFSAFDLNSVGGAADGRGRKLATLLALAMAPAGPVLGYGPGRLFSAVSGLGVTGAADGWGAGALTSAASLLGAGCSVSPS